MQDSKPITLNGYLIGTDSDKASELSIRDIATAIRNSRISILVITLLMVSTACAAAFLMKPVYQAEALLAHMSDEMGSGAASALGSQLSGLASLAGVNIDQQSNERETALATLRSRAFTTQFINERNLKPILFAKEWDAENSRWINKEEIPTDADALERFNKIRSVSEDQLAGMIRVAIRWNDPALAAQWTNLLVADLNLHLRESAIRDAERSSEYLQRELEKTSILELRQAIFKLLEIRINKIMLANVREEYAFRIIDPAVVADADDFVSPKRAIMIIAALLLGLIIGMFIAVVRASLEHSNADSVSD